jgi:hypothetical protein
LYLGLIRRHLLLTLASKHRYLLRQAVEHPLLSPFNELLFFFELGHLGLRIFF